MPEPNIGQLTASVWARKVGKSPEDNVFTSQWVLHTLEDGGFREQVEGGHPIEVTLEYAENTTFEMINELDTISTTRIDIFDAGQSTMRIAGGSVVLSEYEKLRAQASAGKFDLLAAKLDNGKNSCYALINRQLWGAGVGAKDVDGLQKIISITPTTGTVAGISRDLFPFWRNRQASGAKGAGAAYENLRAAMRSVYNQCSNGAFADHPSHAGTDRATFEGFESFLVPNERFTSEDKKKGADAGFNNEILKFKGAKVAFDEDAPAGELRFWNKKFLKLVYYKGGWMKMHDPVEPANQFSMVHKVSTYLQLVTNNSRRLGVVSAIS